MTGDIDRVRIGNASGFYGDRFSAVREMLTGGELDYLTGDYLAELTMLILGRDRLKDPEAGYAKTFLRQMQECLGLAVERGVKIVTNAGGLNPAGLAARLTDLAASLDVDVAISYIDGDNLIERADEFGFDNPVSANAYLGAFGIKAALDAGADVVVTGRVTDASLTVGPAASHFGWGPEDLDALAGAVVAGHIIECGAQATGGNYAFFTELDMSRPLGFPIAEVAAHGSSVITKHADTGGGVTVGTVTAQLLYEITGPRYLNPDVTARMDSVHLVQDGTDRVAVSGVRGEAPPKNLKVSLNRLAGFRNEMDLILTGLDIEAKAQLVAGQLQSALENPPAELTFTLARTDHPDADTEETASAVLRCVARDTDPTRVGRELSSAVVGLALASYPGFAATTPPTAASPYGIYEAGYVDAEAVTHRVNHSDGSVEEIPPSPMRTDVLPPLPAHDSSAGPVEFGPTVSAPLGRIAGARSGDKGGGANVGVWVRSAQEFAWLDAYLDTALLRKLLPEAADLEIHRHRLPNLYALNFVIDGLLGRGVADNVRFDPQAKGLGEWLRSRVVEIPQSFVDDLR